MNGPMESVQGLADASPFDLREAIGQAEAQLRADEDAWNATKSDARWEGREAMKRRLEQLHVLHRAAEERVASEAAAQHAELLARHQALVSYVERGHVDELDRACEKLAAVVVAADGSEVASIKAIIAGVERAAREAADLARKLSPAEIGFGERGPAPAHERLTQHGNMLVQQAIRVEALAIGRVKRAIARRLLEAGNLEQSLPLEDYVGVLR